ncbi:MAG: hypothetical protein PHD12_02000 [Methylotenera sp.]|jgi:hypothetical protein|nr:hypothetical protein [Methylotenera sp.]
MQHAISFTTLLKRVLISAFLLCTANLSMAADVGVSISIGQPGFYGHIDIGDYPYPPPRVIYRKPIMVHRHTEMVEPVYLRVPPGHAKNWPKYCGRYHACGQPVYFVQDSWYQHEYAPIYRERHHEGYDDRQNNGRHHEQSRGHGKGKNKGKHHD